MPQENRQEEPETQYNEGDSLLPPFRELIAPLPQPNPKEDLVKFQDAFNQQAQGGLRAVVVTEPPRQKAANPIWRHFFYLISTRPHIPKVELFRAEHGPESTLASQRYPVTLYYPRREPYHGAALYDRGIVLLDDGNYAADSLSDALWRIFRSKYVRDVIGRLYRESQESAAQL